MTLRSSYTWRCISSGRGTGDMLDIMFHTPKPLRLYLQLLILGTWVLNHLAQSTEGAPIALLGHFVHAAHAWLAASTRVVSLYQVHKPFPFLFLCLQVRRALWTDASTPLSVSHIQSFEISFFQSSISNSPV